MVGQTQYAYTVQRIATDDRKPLSMAVTNDVGRRVDGMKPQTFAQRGDEGLAAGRGMSDFLEQENVDPSTLGPGCERVSNLRFAREVQAANRERACGRVGGRRWLLTRDRERRAGRCVRSR